MTWASQLLCFMTKKFFKVNHTLYLWASQRPLVVKNPANAGDTRDVSSIPGSGRYPVVGNGSPYSSILAWKIHAAEEPDRLQSMRPQKVRHD